VSSMGRDAVPRRRVSSCCPEAERARAAAGMEAALLKAPIPSSRRGVPTLAMGGPGAPLCSRP